MDSHSQWPSEPPVKKVWEPPPKSILHKRDGENGSPDKLHTGLARPTDYRMVA